MPGRAAGRRVDPPRRGSGQHFLDNGRIASRLVGDAGVTRTDRVVDLGAGTGVLTAALAERAGSVLAIEIEPSLAGRLARRFAAVANVTVLRADLRDVPLPCTPYRVVANPPFAHTSAILHRLLDDPGGGLVRADLVVQWQVARQRVRAQERAPVDLTGATWWPWWQFARGRRLPAASFNPRPSVDAAILTVTRRTVPALPAGQFTTYRAFLETQFERSPGASSREGPAWVERFRTRP